MCGPIVNNDIKLGVGLGNQMLNSIQNNKGLEWLPVMKCWNQLSALQWIDIICNWNEQQVNKIECMQYCLKVHKKFNYWLSNINTALFTISYNDLLVYHIIINKQYRTSTLTISFDILFLLRPSFFWFCVSN